jgi:PAS domain S-box-containing protein
MRQRSRAGSKRAGRQKAETRKRGAAPTMRRRPSYDDRADEVDIDDRRKAEGAIRESEYKLRQIIDTVPSLVWATGPNGENTYANRRILDYIGAPYEDFKNSGWQRFVHPDDLPETLNAFQHAVEAGTSYETVHRVRRADGEFRWHHTRGEPMRDREGRIIQWYGLTIDVDEAKKAEERLRHLECDEHHLFSERGELVEAMGTNVDVTERKRVEEALRRGEAWLAQAQRLSHTGTWVLDGTTRRFLYWSDESYRIWGFDPLQGLPTRDDMWGRIHPDDQERLWKEVQEALREQRDFFEEFRILLPDGTVRYLEANTHHEFSPLGELLEVICTNVDVTERKRAQDEHERLRQLEADLAHLNRVSTMGELAASLFHEILHPIATARNNARAGMRFLEMNPPNLDEAREALACVVRDADRAKDIIGRMRDHIKKAPPRRDCFGFNEAVSEVIAMVGSAIARSGISVSTCLMDGPAPVQGDRVQLQQVLVNLILNAAEAMSSVEDGTRELSIRTEQSQTGGILVAVHDSGPGVDPVNFERVFEPFYTTKTSGIGMGLSICQAIIHDHGGRLSMRANEPRGAVFQFTLPAAQQDP